MSAGKRVFALRMEDGIFDKTGVPVTKEHRFMTDHIEYVLREHLKRYKTESGKTGLDKLRTKN